MNCKLKISTDIWFNNVLCFGIYHNYRPLTQAQYCQKTFFWSLLMLSDRGIIVYADYFDEKTHTVEKRTCKPSCDFERLLFSSNADMYLNESSLFSSIISYCQHQSPYKHLQVLLVYCAFSVILNVAFYSSALHMCNVFFFRSWGLSINLTQ